MGTARQWIQNRKLLLTLKLNARRHPAAADAKTFRLGGGSWGAAVNRTYPKESIWDSPCKIHGHMTPRPRIGDQVSQEMESGNTLMGTIDTIDLMSNPPDMFFATVRWHEYNAPTPAPPGEGS